MTSKTIKTKRPVTRKSAMFFLTLALIITSLLYLFPLLWFLLSAFKPGTELFAYPLKIIPENPTIQNFIDAWTTLDFFRYFNNTLISAVVTTLLTILVHNDWSVIRSLGLYDNLLGIIIPSINTATGIFMFRTFFVSVPDDLIESARIDGASDGMIFLKIMLPIARPIIMTLGIFSFQWRWNDYIWPLIVLNDPKKYTLQVAIRSLVGAENINWTILIAASVISILPLLLVFLAFQRWILDSNLDSGLK